MLEHLESPSANGMKKTPHILKILTLVTILCAIMGHGFVMCVSSLQQRAAISSCAIEAVTAYSRTMMMMIDVYTKVFQNGEEKEKFLKCTFVSSDLKDIGDIYYLQTVY